ncbi:hypothetical protein COLO4_33996 [Corchorus olitorius]|uniref:Uncharacterized protein n=1 Tax=Corchorus olitorius TaxID=93759 RepID=A0A1R3GPA0_9ROSI|nr:hypothetical protein COLO4_33996 [Corchorus olitorius]
MRRGKMCCVLCGENGCGKVSDEEWEDWRGSDDRLWRGSDERLWRS